MLPSHRGVERQVQDRSPNLVPEPPAALIGRQPREGGDRSESGEVHSGQRLLPDGPAIDHDHEVEPPGIRLDLAAAPPDRTEPIGDPQVRIGLVERHRVVVRCGVGVGLARANDLRELVQQLIRGAVQLQRRRADAHIEEGVVLHGVVALLPRLRRRRSDCKSGCTTGASSQQSSRGRNRYMRVPANRSLMALVARACPPGHAAFGDWTSVKARMVWVSLRPDPPGLLLDVDRNWRDDPTTFLSSRVFRRG